MTKKWAIAILLLLFFITACQSEAQLPPESDVIEPTSTPGSTERPAGTNTPRPTAEPDPLPSPTFTTDRIYIMGFGWADNDQEYEEGMINISIRGAGLEKMEISLESNLDFSIMLTIVPGTIFTTSSPSVQSMVARELREIILEPHLEISLELEVACANMPLDAPESEHFFTAIWPPSNLDLSKLVTSTGFLEQESFRVQQFAVWVITDNPTRDNFTRLGSAVQAFGPSQDEINQIKQIFLEAGISTDEYLAFD